MPTCPAGHDSASSDFCDVCGMRIDAVSAAVTPPSAGPSPAAAQPASPEAPPADVAAEPCPQCGTARSGRFCETCGRDFETGRAPKTSHLAAAGNIPTAAEGAPAVAGAPATGSAEAAGGVPPAAGNAQAADGAGLPVTGPVTTAQQAPAWTAVAASDRAYYDGVIAAGGPDAVTIEFPAYCPERRFQLTGKEMRIGRHSASRGLYPEIDLTGPPTDPGVSRLHAVLIAQPDGGWAVVDPGSENGTLINGTEIASGAQVPLHDGDRIHLGAWTVITIHVG